MPHARVAKIHRSRAKQARRTITRAEAFLWRYLKAQRLAGFSFRRQAPMGAYTADFVSHACRLVIELDGESHDFESRQQADRRRDAWFTSRGYKVLRFTNDDVLKNLEGVVAAISDMARSTPPSLTLPRKGGGDAQTTAGDW